mmetsp:Transcript_78313/g.155152  ORF Transcript_78313/g.155152 Transcript_78313/m.155152 type:complete len:366 (+) Transcript_78313:62-1159(+)
MSARGTYTLAKAMDDSEGRQLLSQQCNQNRRTAYSGMAAAIAVALVASCAFLTFLCDRKPLHRSFGDTVVPIEFAASSSPGTHIVAEKSERCLDWSGIIVKSVVCSETPKQHWTYNTVHEIKTSGNRCLDMGGEKVHVWECNVTDKAIDQHQHWVYDLVSHQIKHHHKKDICLQDSKGEGEVNMKSCSPDAEDQKWELKISSTLDSPSDSGKGQSSGAGGKLAGSPVQIRLKEGDLCLDASELRTCNNAIPGQRWTLASGQFKSPNGCCLAANKANVTQACSEKPEQEWIFNDTKGLLRAKSGTCLAAPEDAPNGSEVVTMKACDESSKAQQWQITPLDGAALSHGTVSCVTQFLLALVMVWSLM